MLFFPIFIYSFWFWSQRHTLRYANKLIIIDFLEYCNLHYQGNCSHLYVKCLFPHLYGGKQPLVVFHGGGCYCRCFFFAFKQVFERSERLTFRAEFNLVRQFLKGRPNSTHLYITVHFMMSSASSFAEAISILLATFIIHSLFLFTSFFVTSTRLVFNVDFLLSEAATEAKLRSPPPYWCLWFC